VRVHLVLAQGVRHLDEQPAVFEAMLAGWERQQRSRYLQAATIGPRLRMVWRLAEFTGQYPWQWGPAEVEEFTSSLVSGPRPLAHSTVRGYQMALQLFCGFVTDRRYGWAEECERRFGQAPVQVCHEWNTVAHLAEYEGRAGRRALTYDEVQALFDAADSRVGQIRSRGRKGGAGGAAGRGDPQGDLCVWAAPPGGRQAGCRGSEAESAGAGLWKVRVGAGAVWQGVAGQPAAAAHGADGPGVRLGDRGAGPVGPGGPAAAGAGPASGAVGDRAAGPHSGGPRDHMFIRLRQEAGLAEELDLHALRHSYVTHLLEFGYPPLMVQQQAGHAWGSTTALYTSVSDEFRNRLLEQSLQAHPELWAEETR
jgi:Phage integrase family